MRLGAMALLSTLMLAGCADPGPGPATSSARDFAGPTTQATSTAATSTTTATTAAPWQPYTPPLLPMPEPSGEAWVRGPDLGPEWNVTTDPVPGGFVLAWFDVHVTQEPPPRHACGVSISPGTELHVPEHRIRTLHSRSEARFDEADAFVSVVAHRPPTGCDGKGHHVLIEGTWRPAIGVLPAPPAFAANGTLVHDGLTLPPGGTAVRETRTTLEGDEEPVQVTTRTRVVHLGWWPDAGIEYEASLQRDRVGVTPGP